MLDRAKYMAASVTFKAWWLRTMQETLPPEVMAPVNLLCMQEDTMDAKVHFSWFDSIPIMRHWVGDRVAHELSAKSVEYGIQPWELTLRVLRDDLMFDRLERYRRAIMKIANETKLMVPRELGKLLADGFTGTLYGNCFDGYPLFSANHSTGDNKDTPALSASSLASAVGQFKLFADPVTGDRLGIAPTHLWFHTDLAETVRDLLTLSLISDGTTTIENKWKGRLQPLELSLMPAGSEKYWGLVHISSDPMKPVMLINRPGSEQFTALDKPDDTGNFTRRELLYGTEKWAKLAPGIPFYIWGSDGTT